MINNTIAELERILGNIPASENLSEQALHGLGQRFSANILKAEFERVDGSVDYAYGHNARTNAGASYIAGALFNTSVAALNYMALSSATLTPAMGDTTLASEITTTGLARKTATYGGYTAPASLGATSSCTLSASYTNGGGGAVSVTSVGLLSAASGGTLGFEANLSAGNTLNPGDSVAITYTLQT